MEINNEKYIGKMIKILSISIRRKFENELNQKGIELTSSQSRILGFVYHRSQTGNVYQRDIEEEFGIRRSSVTNTLQLLEKNGYISRVSVEEDARLKKLLLTEKGISIHEDVIKVLFEVEGTLSSVYTKEELSELFNLLDKLNTILEEK